MAFRVTTLPGDGIGPEVMSTALEVLQAVDATFDLNFEITEKLVGGAAIDKCGAPLPDDTLAACKNADAVLLGAVGGPAWDNLPHDQKPERALLGLREQLGLFTNLRPARVYPALIQASSLKKKVLAGTDLVVVRELTGGIYFGQPRGYNAEKGWNTLVYQRHEVERIARVAFDLARKRRGRVTSVHKSNVLESSQFWREIVHEVHAEYEDVQLADMYVDNAAMQLVRDPRQFDVLVTQNMFGDILSDIASMITGSLGMLPSASLGERYALYEPVHGSAPDIAGQNKANPLAMIASLAMLLQSSCNQPQAARLLDQAISDTLDEGYRTADIATAGATVVTTTEMGNQVMRHFQLNLAATPELA